MKKFLIAAAALTAFSTMALANDSTGNGDRPFDSADQAPVVKTMTTSNVRIVNKHQAYVSYAKLLEEQRLSEKAGSSNDLAK